MCFSECRTGGARRWGGRRCFVPTRTAHARTVHVQSFIFEFGILMNLDVLYVPAAIMNCHLDKQNINLFCTGGPKQVPMQTA